MAITLSSIETKVRALLGDISETFTDVFTYANSSVFTLSEENIISVSEVYQNSSELASGDWSYSSGKVTISASLTTGDSIEIVYTAYPNFSSSEIQSYIQAALTHIGANNCKDFLVVDSIIFPEPEDREISLIAMISSLLIEPDNRSISLPDVRISVPKDLPTHDKIRRTIGIFKHDTHGVFGVI